MAPWKEKNLARRELALKIINLLRIKEGLAGEELMRIVGERTGYAEATVSVILSGYRDFTVDVRRRFLAAYPFLARIIPMPTSEVKPAPPTKANQGLVRHAVELLE